MATVDRYFVRPRIHTQEIMRCSECGRQRLRFFSTESGEIQVPSMAEVCPDCRRADGQEPENAR